METIKLERNGKVVERAKADYEMNKSAYDLRGFKEYVEKPKPQPKPEPKVDSEWQKEEPKAKPLDPNKPISLDFLTNPDKE